MTQYELYDLFISLRAEAQTTSGLFLTVVSGYLAVAYLVGSSLTRIQAATVTGIFLVFTLTQIAGHFLTMMDIAVLASDVDLLRRNSADADGWGFLFFLIHAAIILASLIFMWQIRRPKTV